MTAPSTDQEIREVNERYHDVAAVTYDSKWGIDFGPIGLSQVEGKLEKVLGKPVPNLGRVVEIGAGTGYFSLNLLLGGKCDEVVATDISPGMVKILKANAKRLGLKVEAHACEAAALPLEDESVDTVIGHAARWRAFLRWRAFAAWRPDRECPEGFCTQSLPGMACCAARTPGPSPT